MYVVPVAVATGACVSRLFSTLFGEVRTGQSGNGLKVSRGALAQSNGDGLCD